MNPVLAIDIGGTKLAAGIVDASGTIVHQSSRPTRAGTDGEALFADVVALCESVVVASGVHASMLSGVGVGCGGPMTYPEGRVSPINIPAWRAFPLRERLEHRFALPTVVDNDAKAFALGEWLLGAGRGSRCLLGMVVSTGVGGGIVEDGRLVHGARGNAGHVGHVVAFQRGAPCGCGGRGCVEAVASGTGVARRAAAAIADGAATSLPLGPDAAQIAAAARQGDQLASKLYREAGQALGRGIAAAAVLLDIDRVVIGGSVAIHANDLLFPPLRAELQRLARLDFCRGIDVVASALGVDAALGGAAALALSDQ